MSIDLSSFKPIRDVKHIMAHTQLITVTRNGGPINFVLNAEILRKRKFNLGEYVQILGSNDDNLLCIRAGSGKRTDDFDRKLSQAGSISISVGVLNVPFVSDGDLDDYVYRFEPLQESTDNALFIDFRKPFEKKTKRHTQKKGWGLA